MLTIRSIAFRALTVTLLLLFPLICTGCNMRRPGIYQVGNWGPSMFVEDGQLVSLYTLQVEKQVSYLRGSSLNTYTSILYEHSSGWKNNDFDHTNARGLWYSVPAWRQEENLLAIGQRLTADQPANRERFLISSHNPVVVGMTDDVDEIKPPNPFYNFLFFIPASTTPNASYVSGRRHKVTRLFICRTWPEPDAKLGPPADREILVLPAPMKVEEVMATRPWLTPGK